MSERIVPKRCNICSKSPVAVILIVSGWNIVFLCASCAEKLPGSPYPVRWGRDCIRFWDER